MSAETEAPPERKQLGEHTTAPWKVKALLECPQKFFLGAVAKDPRRKESGLEAQVGTLLHHGIEQVAWLRTWVTGGPPEGRPTAIDYAVTPEELLRGIDQPTTPRNPSVERARRDPAALAEARLVAKKVAKHVELGGLLIEQVGLRARPLVEEPWTLDVGEVDGARVVVGGIWDMVRRARGKLVILDWKKGGELKSSDELRLDPAATLYAAAAHARWPKEPVRVEHHLLARGMSVGLDWTPEVDEWARTAALEHARAVAAFTRENVWPATPSQKACTYCSYKASCSAFRERVDLAPLGAFDLARVGDLEGVVRAARKGREDVAMVEGWREELDKVLEAALLRAAELGEDELIVAGSVVRRAKRTTMVVTDWRRALGRAWEITGLPPEELQDAALSLSLTRLEDHLAARGFSEEQRQRVRNELERTGEEKTSTWIEVRPLADPVPVVDVDHLLRTGVRVKPITRGANSAGPAPQAAPATPESAALPAAGVAPPGAPHSEEGEPVPSVVHAANPGGSEAIAELAHEPGPGAEEIETTRFGRVLTPDERAALIVHALPPGWARTVQEGPCAVCGKPAWTVDAEPLFRHFPGCLGPQVVAAGWRLTLETGQPLGAEQFAVEVAPAEDPKAAVGFGEAGLRAGKNPCPDCGKSFQNARGLASHRRLHRKAAT